MAGLCAAVWTVQPATAASAHALLNGTTTTLSVNSTSVKVGDTVTMTATVTSSSGTPTGSVNFYSDNTEIADQVALNASGTATFSTNQLPQGSHSLTASFNYSPGFRPSSSPGVTVTVGSAAPTVHPTNVALSVNPTSVQTGQSATLSATVTAADGDPAVPTGSVEFYDNGNDLGGATLNGSGVATLSSSGFIAGTNAITATYAGDTTHSGASASAVNITATNPVTVYGTTTSLAASPSTVQTGASESLTATVTASGGGTPSGSVQFYDNDVPIGDSVGLNGSGVASLKWSGFTAGSHSLTAKYQGDSTHHTSTSTHASVTATAPPSAVTTSITPSISPNPIVAGGSATLSAHVVQVGTQTAPPQGSIVTFRNGGANGTLLGQGTLDASGNASVVVSGWKAGTYTITAVYTGDATDAPSSQGQSVTVRPVTTLTVTAPSPTVTYGAGIPTLTPTYSGFVNGDSASSLTTPPTCTTAATGSAPATGTYDVTCSGASDIYYSFTYVSGTLTVQKAPLVVTPPSATISQGSPLPTLTPTITGFVNGETLSTSDVTGSASCTTTATSSSPTGTYPVTCTLGTLSSSNYSFSVSGQGTLRITAAGSIPTTSVAWVGGPILVGHSVTLWGSLFSDWTQLGGEKMTLSLGSVSCTATTNQAGFATCSVVPTGPLGPTTSTASFAGDDTYAASTGSRSALLYALPSGGGAFVVGDASSARSTSVTFWGSQWWKDNDVSRGDPSKDFKGYAGSPSVPTIGATWTASPGDSSSPPAAPLPSYMGVIVTDSATQSHSTISGTICNIAIVKTDSGYAPNPGHSGTGTIVDSINHLTECSSDHGGDNGGGGGDNGHGGGDNGHGHGSGSPNDYASNYGDGSSSDAHWTRHGYSTCPAL